MPITIILGEQRGDEGKGRFVDMLGTSHDIVARFNGGNNAGHTVVLPDGRVLKLHLIPSGIAHKHTKNIIGNGTLVNPVKLVEEMDLVRDQGIEITPDNLMISSAAHVVMPHHISADEIREAGKGQQGSTKSGIAQVASEKYLRTGIRCEKFCLDLEQIRNEIITSLDKQHSKRIKLNLPALNSKKVADEYIKAAEILAPFVSDTVMYLNQKLRDKNPAKVLAEGAQAFLLDIDHGMYPYTTSSSTTSGGVSSGLGVAPVFISRTVGVIKAIQSHVGGGNFVTEILDPTLLAKLHGQMDKIDSECGTTTGRVRRLGHLDLPGIRRSQMINGTNEVAITKLDWVSRYGKEVTICTNYELNGKQIDVSPDPANLVNVKPVYEELPTWQENIEDIREFDNLPKNAQNYINFIEDKLGTKIRFIGVGPNRDQVIVR